DPRAFADDVYELGRSFGGRLAVCSERRHRRCGAGSAGCDQFGSELPAQRSAGSACLQQNESGGRAGADSGAYIKKPDALQSGGFGRYATRAEDLASKRRWPGNDFWRTKTGYPDTSDPGLTLFLRLDAVKSQLSIIQQNLPVSLKVHVLTDRTITIRASVEDVEFELMLTIALVVMVIFLFLRSLRATIIPTVAVPLSLVGTFAVMYAL